MSPARPAPAPGRFAEFIELLDDGHPRQAESRPDSVLQEHRAVVASCTIGVPDPAVGERIKSFVVMKDDVKGVGGQERHAAQVQGGQGPAPGAAVGGEAQGRAGRPGRGAGPRSPTWMTFLLCAWAPLG